MLALKVGHRLQFGQKLLPYLQGVEHLRPVDKSCRSLAVWFSNAARPRKLLSHPAGSSPCRPGTEKKAASRRAPAFFPTFLIDAIIHLALRISICFVRKSGTLAPWPKSAPLSPASRTGSGRLSECMAAASFSPNTSSPMANFIASRDRLTPPWQASIRAMRRRAGALCD